MMTAIIDGPGASDCTLVALSWESTDELLSVFYFFGDGIKSFRS